MGKVLIITIIFASMTTTALWVVKGFREEVAQVHRQYEWLENCKELVKEGFCYSNFKKIK